MSEKDNDQRQLVKNLTNKFLNFSKVEINLHSFISTQVVLSVPNLYRYVSNHTL